MSEAQRFVDERVAITRKVRDTMASAQDKKAYAYQTGRKNNECLKWGINAIAVLPGGTTKLLPLYIGSFT